MVFERILGLNVKSQQLLMRELGIYKGAVDGIWGDLSVAAMNDFKSLPEYAPASPRRSNTPFLPFDRLPKGYKWEVIDGQRCILKVNANTPHMFVVQGLIDAILDAETTNTVLPTQETENESEEAADEDLLDANSNVCSEEDSNVTVDSDMVSDLDSANPSSTVSNDENLSDGEENQEDVRGND